MSFSAEGLRVVRRAFLLLLIKIWNISSVMQEVFIAAQLPWASGSRGTTVRAAEISLSKLTFYDPFSLIASDLTPRRT